ncbi:MAG: peptidylprolyl isomerase [Cetobacterium sp.]|uniref:peptidylprolyl isomerase n=1 Tax=unclassified Cetobacterium TaxID=2630983 RepID=UPI00163BED89|nr:peptidylprolyl isomerase [Cetobacterium sp. 2A]MBC2856641.1 peptidylprolyl isomerase [Cetobacterium sp. 2A]
MKKLFKILLLIVMIISATGCSYVKSATKRNAAVKYNDIRATFVTSQGDITFYLYPEAAPITVANFINLSKRGFYNNTKIHRAVENFVVQGGDPTGTGNGGPGYEIPDEIVAWLDFYQQGILAMANAGPNTGGSQYFMTLYPADWLNGKHTIFGEYVEDSDFEKIKKLEIGDVIKEVRFTGDVDLMLSLNKQQVEEWNKILDEKYPKLNKYPIKDISSYGTEVQNYKNELEAIYTSKGKSTEEEKEFFIPRFIRATEKKFKEAAAEEETL